MNGSEAKLEHKRTLIIEDDPDGARSLQILLQLLGYEVQVARSGMEGLRLAALWEPENIICDVSMPGMDGWSVARELRRHPFAMQVNLIALTAFGTESDQRRSYEAGFDHHLVKPLDHSLLLKLLRRPATSIPPAGIPVVHAHPARAASSGSPDERSSAALSSSQS